MKNTYNDLTDNELIAKLPPVRNEEAYIAAFEKTPYINEMERGLSVSERAMCVSRLSDFRVAREFGYAVDFRIAEALRKGYRLSKKKDVIPDDILGGSVYKKMEGDTTAFVLIGPSGVGKTTVLNASLEYYDQVITHVEPKYTAKQIAYIKVECPPGGSMKSFYDSCINEMEQALDYELPDKSRYKTTDQKEQLFKKIAVRWNLGLLIIDEIQNLLASKNHNLMNQFLTLTNELSVPIIFIGTDKIMDYFTKTEFFTKRRLGVEIHATVYEKDPLWNSLMQSMWTYQWMKEYIPLTEELSDVFYEETGGIINRVVELYANAQREAILSGRDTIKCFTPDFIRRVSQKYYSLSRGSLKAFVNPDTLIYSIPEADLKQAAIRSNQESIQMDAVTTELRESKKILTDETNINKKSNMNVLKNNVLTNILSMMAFLPYSFNKAEINHAVDNVFKDVKIVSQKEEIITRNVMAILLNSKPDKTEKKAVPVVTIEQIPMFEGVI